MKQATASPTAGLHANGAGAEDCVRLCAGMSDRLPRMLVDQVIRSTHISGRDPLNTYQRTATFEFIYGQPILMDTFLQVDVQFDNQTSMVAGTLDSMIDLGNSSYWGGIRRLRDAAGNPVTNVVYTSSSGVDYRASAMAPPTLQFRRLGDALRLEWTGNYRLQSAPAPAGNYTTLTNATNPYLVHPTELQQFFRLVLAR